MSAYIPVRPGPIRHDDLPLDSDLRHPARHVSLVGMDALAARRHGIGILQHDGTGPGAVLHVVRNFHQDWNGAQAPKQSSRTE